MAEVIPIRSDIRIAHAIQAQETPTPLFTGYGYRRHPQHVHEFDAVSGWCRCGQRDDGRHTTPGGTIDRVGHTELELGGGDDATS